MIVMPWVILASLLLTSTPVPSLDPVREQIAEYVIEQLEGDLTGCLGKGEDLGRSGVIFCAYADTSNLRKTQRLLDKAMKEHDKVGAHEGPWEFQNKREFNHRVWKTETGPIEIRLYYTKNLAAVYFPLDDYTVEVEVVSCDDPELVKRFESVVDHEGQDGYEPPEQYARGPALYPESAEGTGLRGRVEVKAIVATDGTVSDACIVSANPANAGFESPALSALMTCRFEPAKLQGKPVETVVSTSIMFSPGQHVPN